MKTKELPIILKSISFTLFLCVLMSLTPSCKQYKKNNTSNKDVQTERSAQTNDTISINYAKGFKVKYQDNIKFVEISDPSQENSSIYKFALINKNVKPTQEIKIPKDYIKIEVPINKVICMTSLQLSGFITLDKLEYVKGITSTRFLHNKKMQQRIKSGQTYKIGIEGNFDNEIIMSINPDIIFISPFKRGGYDNLKDVGIPLIPHLGYKELTPLGQAEWIKFISLFINEEQLASNTFNIVAEEYNKLKKLTAEVKHRPTIFSGELRGSGWYTVGGKSFLAQLFKDAGANYFLKENDKSGGIVLDFETIYSMAANAEYWRIMNGYPGTFSYNILKQEDSRYEQFKAFKEKKIIYCNQREKGFYESSPTQPQLVLKDFIKIFHPELIDSNYKGTYYTLLK